jgi:uncharacterized protein YqgC (DUF456 family)
MAFILLTLVLVASLALIALGLPGLWVMIASAIVYNLVVGTEPISWVTIVGIGILGIVAEWIEFTMSGKYARKFGGSRRAGWGAMLGGVVGAFIGVPVPIVGPIIGAFVGSFVGALAGELSMGSGGKASTRAATGADIGRAVATAMKIGVGVAIAMWIFLAAMG